MHISMHLDNDVISGESNHPSDLVTRRFLDSRLQYKSLEGLMDFSISASNVMAKLPDFN